MAMIDSSTPRTQRVEARISPEVLAVIKRAAEIQGRSVSDFLVAAAIKDANRTIEETQLICLSVNEQQRFAELLLLNPPALSPAMQRALDARKRLLDDTK